MKSTQPIEYSGKTKALELMAKHGLTRKGIARGLGHQNPNIVSRALDQNAVGIVGHGNLLKIRERIEALLQAAGEDTTGLWDEYDAALKDAA